jgi:hypothetical protein
MTATLYLADDRFAPIGSSLGSTTFRIAPAAAQYFMTEVDLTIPGLAPGNTSQKFVAVFSAPEFPSFGCDNVPLMFAPGSAAGGGSPPLPPGELIPVPNSLLGGEITIGICPEAPPIVLFPFGFALALLARRK